MQAVIPLWQEVIIGWFTTSIYVNDSITFLSSSGDLYVLSAFNSLVKGTLLDVGICPYWYIFSSLESKIGTFPPSSTWFCLEICNTSSYDLTLLSSREKLKSSSDGYISLILFHALSLSPSSIIFFSTFHFVNEPFSIMTFGKPNVFSSQKALGAEIIPSLS